MYRITAIPTVLVLLTIVFYASKQTPLESTNEYKAWEAKQEIVQARVESVKSIEAAKRRKQDQEFEQVKWDSRVERAMLASGKTQVVPGLHYDGYYDNDDGMLHRQLWAISKRKPGKVYCYANHFFRNSYSGQLRAKLKKINRSWIYSADERVNADGYYQNGKWYGMVDGEVECKWFSIDFE